MENITTPGTGAHPGEAADANGASGQPTGAAGAEEARREAVRRAEEMVDRLGEQVGRYVSWLGHSVLKWAARTREEAEDIWAEAQALRESRRDAKEPPSGAPPGGG